MSFNDTVNNVNTSMTNAFSFLDNETVSLTIIILLILYSCWAVSYLPMSVLRLFDYPLFNFIILFIIVYACRKNPSVGLIAGIAFLASIHALHKVKMGSGLMSMMYQRQEPMQQQQHPSMMNDGEMTIEDITSPEVMIPEQAVANIQEEEKSQPGCASGCTAKANFQNSFYPQYVDMNPSAYLARYNGVDVNGYDPESDYAQLQKY
jgi:hypothetical protein